MPAMRAARATGICSSGFGFVLRTVGINKAFHTRIVISSGTHFLSGAREVSAVQDVGAATLAAGSRNGAPHGFRYAEVTQCPVRAIIGH